jgi:hypothetical protein
MRQVARRAGMQRGQEQKRAGLMRGDQLSREFAGEVKTRIDIDCAHLVPCCVTDRERMTGLAPWRRRAVNKMRHLPDGRARLRQQRIAGAAFGEIADPGHAELQP